MVEKTFEDFINVNERIGKMLICGLEGTGKTLLSAAIAMHKMLNGMQDCWKSYEQVDKYNQYQVRVFGDKDIFGERKTKQCTGLTSLAEAKRWALKTQKELSNQKPIPTNEILFKDLEKLYYEERSTKVSPTTLASFHAIRQKLLKFMKNIKAKDISTLICQQFIDQEQKKGLKKKTIKNYVTYLIAVLNWGVNYDFLDMMHIKKLRYRADEEDFEAMTLNIDQLAIMLNDFKTNCYDLYIPSLISLLTSSRRGEVLGLTLDKINFEDETIRYSNNLICVGGKPYEKSIMKTKGSKRVVPMADFLKEELLEHLQNLGDMQRIDDHICSNVMKGLITPDYLTHRVHDYIKLKFNINMREHDFRHNFSQLFEDNEELLIERSRLMGHSNTRITQSVYTKQNLTRVRNHLNILANELKQKMQELAKAKCLMNKGEEGDAFTHFAHITGF